MRSVRLDKHDWCCYTESGVILCMRVQSNKPSKGKSGGWLHNTGDTTRIVYVPVKPRNMILEETTDFHSIWIQYQKSTTPQSLIIFSEKLGLDPMSVHLIGCSWSFKDNAWAFPMKNELSEVIGIRLRNDLGSKYAVKGSKAGLFIPEMAFNAKDYLYICEGPTDTAAALCMGLQAIGRPSCLGLEEMISKYISKKSIKRVVIVADNDDPGQRGALKLQQSLKASSCILTLPAKDIRAFYNIGGTKKALESILKQQIWNKK